MNRVSTKEKRAGIRIPLLSEKIEVISADYHQVTEISDITTDGSFIKTSELLPPQTKVLLRISLPGDLGSLDIQGQIIRVKWAKKPGRKNEHLGMGIKFADIDENKKKILDAYVVYLRNKQIITVSKRIIEEFFGGPKGGPKKRF